MVLEHFDIGFMTAEGLYIILGSEHGFAGAHDGLEAVGVVLAQQAGHRRVAEVRRTAADAARHRQAVVVHCKAQDAVQALRVHA